MVMGQIPEIWNIAPGSTRDEKNVNMTTRLIPRISSYIQYTKSHKRNIYLTDHTKSIPVRNTHVKVMIRFFVGLTSNFEKYTFFTTTHLHQEDVTLHFHHGYFFFHNLHALCWGTLHLLMFFLG